MKKYVMALTYPPKIPDVISGECRQTVRLVHKGPEPLPASLRLKRPGDELLMHTWTGKPYRSPWGWRGRFVLTEVLELFYFDGWAWSPLGGLEKDGRRAFEPVPMSALLDIARRDHIDPPTVEAWEEALMRLNGLKSLVDTDWEVLRWGGRP